MGNEWNNKIQARFDELFAKSDAFVLYRSDFGGMLLESSYYQRGYEWLSNAKQLLKLACGDKSQYVMDFENFYANIHDQIASSFPICQSIFKAAKNDYENGLITDQKTLIAKNLLGLTIEQAEILSIAKYYQAAAIVAGVALETKLRDMCEKADLPVEKPSINSYNTALYKAEKYSKVTNQEIITWAAIRNDAAHGQSGTFTAEQVDGMIKGITSFLDKY